MASGIHLSWFAGLSIVGGLTLLGIAWRGWPFQRYPGAKTWTIILIVIALWDISYGIALSIFIPELRWWFDIPVFFARALSVPLILVFALQYTGRESLARSKWMYGVFGFYILSFLLAATNPIHQLMLVNYHISPVFGAAAVDFTPRLYYILAGISYLTILIVVVIFADMIARYRTVFGRQVVPLIVALLVSSVANIAWILRLGPTRHLDLTPLGHIVAAVLVTYAIFRQDMFQIIPATRYKAEQAALDDLGSAVFSITNDGWIVNLNSRACELLEVEKDTILLETITDYIQIDLPEAESRFTLSDPFGRRNEYTVVVSEIASVTGEKIGYTIALQDITTERIRQQRLSVLNRVLRHNLRNTLNVIDGYAAIIEEEANNSNEYAILIREAVTKLLQIGEKARTVEEIVDRQGKTQNAEISDVIAESIRSVNANQRECTVTVESMVKGVQVNSAILMPVIREIIDNGCRHNDADEPFVTINVSVDYSAAKPISIIVRDNGPGIPIHELAPLRDRSETALEHGSGIGLWLVDWGVSVLNGELDISENTSQGTTVTVRLPAAE